jgi:hypothetical protein
VNAWRSPSRIFSGHAKDQSPNLLANRLPAAAHLSGARDPSPVKPKASAMPGYHRLRCNQDERLFPARPEPSQDNPERFVQCSDAVARSFGVQGEQLLTERQVFQKQFLVGPEDANDPGNEVPEHGDHRAKSYRKDQSHSSLQVDHSTRAQGFDEAQPAEAVEGDTISESDTIQESSRRGSPRVQNLQSQACLSDHR